MSWFARRADDGTKAFRRVAEQAFGELAKECGSKLEHVDSDIFGFCTPHAVLTIGAYPGHFRSICVKVRRREKGEAVAAKDGADVGLANVELFVTGQQSRVHTQRKAWEADAIREEVEALAEKTREVAWTFLTSPHADWAGLRALIDRLVEKSFEDMPRLKKYKRA